MTSFRPTPTIVLEGTYPVTLGGISTWMDLLLSGSMPARILRIGALPPEDTWAYTLPGSVEAFEGVDEPADFSRQSVRDWSRIVAARIPAGGVVHAIGAGLAASVGLAAQRRGCPLIVSEHASYVEELRAGSPFLESGRMVQRDEAAGVLDTFEQIRHDLYRRADMVTSLYPERMDDQVSRGLDPARARVIANGVEVPDTICVPPEACTAVFLGRLNPIKRPDVFVDLIDAASDDVEIRGHLVGPFDCPPCEEAGLRRRLEQSRAVTWRGPQPMPTALSDASVLVLTSDLEAQPLAVLEAMARGIPVIATDVGDVRRMVTDPALGAPGGVVSRNPDVLLRALRTLASNPERHAMWGRSARTRVQRHFNVTRMRTEFSLLHAFPTTPTRVAS
ncbi:MAG: GT4 family glycosyltransferase PelF [Myxococcota bacterium]